MQVFRICHLASSSSLGIPHRLQWHPLLPMQLPQSPCQLQAQQTISGLRHLPHHHRYVVVLPQHGYGWQGLSLPSKQQLSRCFALSRPRRQLGRLLICINTSGVQTSAAWRTSAATSRHEKHTVDEFIALSTESQAVKQQERNENLVSCKAGCSASCSFTI